MASAAIWIIVIVVIIVILLGVGLGVYFYRRSRRSKPPPVTPLTTTTTTPTAVFIPMTPPVTDTSTNPVRPAPGSLSLPPPGTGQSSINIPAPGTQGGKSVFLLGSVGCKGIPGFQDVGTISVLINPSTMQNLLGPQILPGMIASGNQLPPGTLTGVTQVGADTYTWITLQVCYGDKTTLPPNSGLFGLSSTVTPIGPIGFIINGTTSPFSLGGAAPPSAPGYYWTYPYLIDATDPTAYTLVPVSDPQGTNTVAFPVPPWGQSSLGPSGFSLLDYYDYTNTNQWMTAKLYPGVTPGGSPPPPPKGVPAYVPPPPPPPPKRYALKSDDTKNYLASGDQIYSPGGLYYVTMQIDGNATAYSSANPGNNPFWSTGTYNNPGARLVLQPSGDLQVLNSNREMIHNENIANQGTGPYTLTVSDQGFTIITDSTGKIIWRRPSDNTVGTTITTPLVTAPVTYPSSLKSSDAKNFLRPNEQLVSTGGKYYIINETGDPSRKAGNIVLYSAETPGNNAVWNTGTYGNPGAIFRLNVNGELEVLDSSGKQIHKEGTENSGTAPYTLTVLDSGAAVLRDANGIVTWKRPPNANLLEQSESPSWLWILLLVLIGVGVYLVLRKQ